MGPGTAQKTGVARVIVGQATNIATRLKRPPADPYVIPPLSPVRWNRAPRLAALLALFACSWPARRGRLTQLVAMNLLRKLSPAFFTLLLVAGALLVLAAPAQAADSSRVKALFKNPPREYSTGPLWVWNDLLTEQQIRDTMRDLAAQKVKQVWVHPRPGLMTPYLSNDWFRLWKVALNEAERLDMNVWIYDENSYPSGFAGGWVPELMPESRGRGLTLRETQSAPKWSEDVVAVYRLDGDACENLTAKVKAGEVLPEARYMVATEVRAKNSPWHGNRCYVNLLSPGVTEKFLEVTMEPYRREIGKQFGKRVPGVFTDEPNIHPAGDLPWSEILAQEFQKRWGYSLLDHLPSLKRPVGDWRKVRHNYYEVLNEQFIEHWAKPNYDYCVTNHLEWTGHYWDHEWPNCTGVPDNMAMNAWHQRPSIDCLMNQYQENTHAQFGNARMPKEVSSIANQLGMKRTLVELYGAGGWDLRFEDMKRIGDWLEVLGINTLNQHLSYVTIRGARKRDHPQSFSYHEPWWDAYHISAEYFARVSMALSQGEQINRVLVLEPTTTAWMYQGDGAKLKELGDSFFKLLMALEAAQIEYDIGDEDVIARHGSLEGKQLRVGNRTYRQVLLPPLIENINTKTKAFLDQVNVAVTGTKPKRVDGAAPQSSASSQAALPADWMLKANTIIADLQSDQKKDGFAIERTAGDQGILFHHLRQLADGQILFLVNSSIEHPSRGVVLSNLRGVECWDLYTGKVKPYPSVKLEGGISAKFDLPPSGSLLLFLSPKPIEGEFPQETVTTLATTEPVKVSRLEPNVLTLDYVDVTAGGETKQDIYFYQANQFSWQKNGMERNPWDSAVQFKDELIKKTFPAGSGFSASYKFTIESAVPRNLCIVIERPDLYTITCNGQPVKATPNKWWLDKVFGRIDIASAARTGENVVTIKASPFTMYHELEPAYLLGDFALKPVDKGFVVVPCPASDSGLTSSRTGWNLQGHPFYSAGVSYRERFDVEKRTGRFVVSLPNWCGSVAKVAVNGKPAGFIDAPPWECDVTKWIKRGQNEVEVTVIGTLKNTLGPHHGKPALGSAWPGGFQKGPNPGPPPGAQYSTVAYGLFEPFVLKQAITSNTAR
jgi:alpha-L-rhamnosidase